MPEAAGREAEVLLCCARVGPDAGRDARLRELTTAGLDWDRLVWLASPNRMTVLLYHHLQATCPGAVPAAVMEQLRRYYQSNAWRCLYLTGELIKLAEACRDAGVEMLQFKGPTLASEVYGNIAFRQFSDLDLLIAPRDYHRAAALLQARGFAAEVPFAGEAQDDAFLGFHFQRVFVRASDTGVVDLHWDVSPPRFGPPLGLEQLRGGARAASLGGAAITVPGVEDLLLILALHGARNRWDQLSLVCDIAQLARTNPDLDYDRVYRAAAARGGRRILDLALYLASTLLDAPLPEPVRRRAAADPVVAELAAQCLAWMFRVPAEPPAWSRRAFILRAREHPWDGIRYALSRLVTPTPADVARAALPAWAYYPARPFRLLAERFGRLRPLALYIPTPPEVVTRMLDLAEVGPGDVVYDLGCGDGRLIVAAAARGARAVGVDLDPARIEEAEANARAAGVAGQARFIRGNALGVDLADATVVIVVMSIAANLQLRPRLQRLRPGVRVLSHSMTMGNWAPVRAEIVPASTAIRHVYLWRVGAPAGSAGG